MAKKTTPKSKNQIFNISPANADVIDILNGVSNKSQFICEAIREKYKNDNISEILETSEALFERKVKEILTKLCGDNITIVASNTSIISQGGATTVESSAPQPKEEIKDEISDDDQERLRNLFGNW